MLTISVISIVVFSTVISASNQPVPSCAPHDCKITISQTKNNEATVDWSQSMWDLDLERVDKMILSVNGKFEKTQIIYLPENLIHSKLK